MKVFISWSGARSKAVAEILCEWLPMVIQAAKPWMSSNIDRGAIWFTEINDQLKDTAVGIICLTRENKDRPWILFEAGALAKGLSSNRVCPLLIDLPTTDLDDPLAQFNCAVADKAGLLAMFRTLNKCLAADALKDDVVLEAFDSRWLRFEEKLARAVAENMSSAKVEPKSDDKMLAEILENTRQMQQRIRRVENWANHQLIPIDMTYPPDPLLTTALPKSGLEPRVPPVGIPTVDIVREQVRNMVHEGYSAKDVLLSIERVFGQSQVHTANDELARCGIK